MLMVALIINPLIVFAMLRKKLSSCLALPQSQQGHSILYT